MRRQYATGKQPTEGSTTPAVTRRGCIRSIGAGALAAGGLSVSGTAAAQESNGKMVFVYDDGYVEDYTQTFTIHQQFDAPACTAIPSDALGRSEAFLSEAQLHEMADAGWEVMSHATSHEALGSVTVTEPVEAGDTRVYVDSTVLGRTPNDAEILQGDTRVVREITGDGEDDTGGYLTLDSAVDESFSAGETRVRFTEEVVRRVLKESKDSLEQRGFDVTNFVYPYGRYDQRTESLVKEYYNAVANAHPGGLNTAAALNPYDLRREYFHTGTMSEQQLAEYMDRVASRNTLGLLGGHIRNPELTGERVQLAIEMAQERNLEIVTLQEALEDYGVYEPTATPTSSPTRTARPEQSGPGGTPASPATPTPKRGEGGGIPIVDGVFDWLAGLFR
jgi:peptidoglycan/xylan/chitin deacetylase (PgdA/CDA1 family)